jgi:hypothetical protein
MPPKASWLQRIPEILDMLAAWPAPVVDRASCEKLFGVRRRRAIDLLRYFGGYTSGNTVLIDRARFIARLQEIADRPEVHWEIQRKQKLAAEIDQVRQHRAAARIIIKHADKPVARSVRALPKGVRLDAGRLTVEFADARDLLAQLYDVAQAAATDFDAFVQVAEGSTTVSVDSQ